MNYSDTHRDIVEACQRGERAAQFDLYRLYSKAMYNICLRMVKNEEDAEDLLQNSFVDVFRNLDRFRFQSSVGAWIKRVVVNNCINFLKKKRIQFSELEERHEFQFTEFPSSGQEESPLQMKAIKTALFQLPDGYRVVFSLYAMEGYDHQEIADILGISVATSKSQYSRAKQKLRVLLKEYA